MVVTRAGKLRIRERKTDHTQLLDLCRENPNPAEIIVPRRTAQLLLRALRRLSIHTKRAAEDSPSKRRLALRPVRSWTGFRLARRSLAGKSPRRRLLRKKARQAWSAMKRLPGSS